MNRQLPRRAGPLFGAALVVVGMLAAITPVIPTARALDPTPGPSGSIEPTPAPDPTVAPTPDITPGPEPTLEPDPTLAPDPSLTPDPTAAPDPSSSPEPSAGPDPSAEPSAGPDPSAEPSSAPMPVPSGLHVTHAWVEIVSVRDAVTAKTPIDESLVGAERFVVYRVRVQVVNNSDAEVSLRPILEVSGDSLAWARVPEVDPESGIPFYAASDNGKSFKNRTTRIPVEALRLTTSDDPAGVAAPGVGSAGVNPSTKVTLPAHGFTEVEFAVRATVDATWEATYTFRLRDGKAPVPAVAAPRITLGAKPAIELSPGQRSGRNVADPVPLYKLNLTGVDAPANRPVVTASLVGLRMPFAAPSPYTSPHANYTLVTDACAACHASHTAQDEMLLREPEPQSNLCFRCHDGTGAAADVLADFARPTVPANDPVTSSWYSHPAADASPEDLTREAECVACHQPHNSDATRPVGTTSGWTASGPIRGAAGVSVVNGAPGTAPTYTLSKTSALEYELCFRCHSGYAPLPVQEPAHPSRWALDKGIELNPANVSYHPIEAAGKNQSSAMALSLAGTSPYKLWAFDTNSTIRCVNCHGDSDLANPASPPAADAVLDNHAGPNRALLIAPYRDRDLLASSALYDPADFSLCYVCHAEEPMVDNSGDVRYDTNFNWHGFHLNNISYKGAGGRDIDEAGAGQGNATCAECHFRTHGTALAVGGQTPAKGLVNFAPNTEPYNGQVEFVPATSTTLGTCTLTCHGKPHNGYVYTAAP